MVLPIRISFLGIISLRISFKWYTLQWIALGLPLSSTSLVQNFSTSHNIRLRWFTLPATCYLYHCWRLWNFNFRFPFAVASHLLVDQHMKETSRKIYPEVVKSDTLPGRVFANTNRSWCVTDSSKPLVHLKEQFGGPVQVSSASEHPAEGVREMPGTPLPGRSSCPLPTQVVAL